MGVNLLNHPTYEFPLSNSKDFGCSLGKRKCFSFTAYQPPAKEPRLSRGREDGDWKILLSGAKQPNLDVIRSRNGKVHLSNLPLMAPAKAKVYRTFGVKEGEGNYGFVFSVIDPDFPEKELVMKISIANANFFAEVSALHALNIKNRTPNIPFLHHWFISEQLPPSNCRYWGSIAEKIHSSSQFKKLNKFPVGYVILEKATGGSLASFSQNHLSGSSQNECWKLIDSVLFQLLFTAAALPESSVIHRDIGGSNIMLTSVNGQSKCNSWHFQVGKQLFRLPKPAIKPVLIDYGSAHILELGCSLKTDFRYTTLRYRAPEMMFLSPEASGELQPVFSPATDLFSIALSIIEMIVGDFTQTKGNRQFFNHPFLKHNPPPLLCLKMKEYSEKLRVDESDLKLKYSQRMWAGTLHSGFYTIDESFRLSRYLWGMYMELGIPNNRTWPGVEETDVWSIMDEVILDQKCRNMPHPTGRGLLLSENARLRQFLSEQQISCLLSMLRYNPKHRPSPAALLKSEIFDEFRVDRKSSLQSPCWSVSGSPLSYSQF